MSPVARELTALAATYKKRKKPPGYWCVLDVPEVSIEWARRICTYVGEFYDSHGGRSVGLDAKYVTVQWVNGDQETFSRKHLKIASITDRLAYLGRLAEWNQIHEMQRVYDAAINAESECVEKGERVRVTYDARAECVRGPIHLWVADSGVITAPDEEDAEADRDQLFTPAGWERFANWFSAVVLLPPSKEGGDFLVEIRHGPGCNHSDPCEKPHSTHQEGRREVVPWGCLRRLTVPEGEIEPPSA